MRVPTDLHPEDLQIRIALTRTLRRAREVDQLTLRRVADRVGVSPPAVRAVEQSSNWEARTVMRYARACGWRIEWTLHGLSVPDDHDVMAIVIAALDTSTPERTDLVHWRTVWNNLRRIRVDQTTAVEMATRLGVTENAVHWAETNCEGTAVITAQRHARGLGGRLAWRLHPTGGHAKVGRPVSYDQVAV